MRTAALAGSPDRAVGVVAVASGRSATGRSSFATSASGMTSALGDRATCEGAVSASGRMRLPWYSGQGTPRTKHIARARIRRLLEPASTDMLCRPAPCQVPGHAATAPSRTPGATDPARGLGDVVDHAHPLTPAAPAAVLDENASASAPTKPPAPST